MQAVEDSLRRLSTDYLDLYYLHHVDHETPIEESVRALDDLVRQGKVRYAAVSNYEAWRLMESLWIADSKGLSRFECYQPQYSLVVRDIEQEIVPACAAKGLGVVVWSPLAGGYLTGKYQPGQDRATGSRSEEGWAFPMRFFHPDHSNILATLLEVAAEMGRSPAQVALRWVLDQGFVTSAIVGARTQAQIEETLQAVGWRLPEEARAKLDAASALPLRYPRTMEDGMAERRASAVRIG
jgi:aryl-alcohol dehydrogenase-like predicted oxidoreductase